MVRIKVEYQGRLRCLAQHGPSRTTLTTDAPVDNHGRGESFSPTDLVATALAACVATVMGIYAEGQGISLDGLSAEVVKIMSADTPRRIARLEVTFRMPAGLDAKSRRALERCAEVCPVRLSLSPAIDIPLSFQYPD